MFGPEYPKIHTVFKRDERGVIIPNQLTCREFMYLADVPWRWTEKVDGTNIRLHYDSVEGDVTIGGRTDNAQLPKPLVERLQPVLAYPYWGATFNNTDVTIYGEGYGAKIQKGGGNYRPDQDFIVFDILVGDFWLEPEDVAYIADSLGFNVVPVVMVNTLNYAINQIQLADTFTSKWPGVAPEGMVGRPLVDLYNRHGNRIVTKLKYKDFYDLKRRGPSQTPESVLQ